MMMHPLSQELQSAHLSNIQICMKKNNISLSLSGNHLPYFMHLRLTDALFMSCLMSNFFLKKQYCQMTLLFMFSAHKLKQIKFTMKTIDELLLQMTLHHYHSSSFLKKILIFIVSMNLFGIFLSDSSSLTSASICFTLTTLFS